MTADRRARYDAGSGAVRTLPDSERTGCCAMVSRASRPGGDWRSGSALRSHRRGHWFEPSIAHPKTLLRGRVAVVARLCRWHRRGHWFEPSIAHPKTLLRGRVAVVARLCRWHRRGHWFECASATRRPVRGSGPRRPPRSATNATTPGDLVTWTSRSSAGSPMAVAGGRTDAAEERLRDEPASASTRSTPLVDDHSRLAYTEILPDEKGTDLRSVPAPRSRLLRRSRHQHDPRR